MTFETQTINVAETIKEINAQRNELFNQLENVLHLEVERDKLMNQITALDTRIINLLDVVDFIHGTPNRKKDVQDNATVETIYSELPLNALTKLEKLTIKYFLRKMSDTGFVSEKELIDILIGAVGPNYRVIHATLVGLAKKEILCSYRSRRVQGFRLYATYMIQA